MTFTHAPAPGGAAATENRAAARVSPSDDEILGIASATARKKYRDAADGAPAARDAGTPNRANGSGLSDADNESAEPPGANGERENPGEAPGANPELKRAWQEAQAYREAFATPEEARAATVALADLDRMDALFFSARPEDHAELARTVADLDPKAFASLARAMADHAAQSRFGRALHARRDPSAASLPRDDGAMNGAAAPVAEHRGAASPEAGAQEAQGAGPTQAQAEFFHAANAAAVQGVLNAIESQAERLLPEGISKSARNRLVGEIYRELDGTLRANRQLAGQLREAFRSGALDAEHQRAIVSMITGRARQALPGVAKRVLNEWTSAVVAANQDRHARQRAAERRVDIAGSGGAGNEGRRTMTPRDIDYKRMSDADILNL